MKPKICIITSTRAEYGLLSPLIRALSLDPKIDFRLLVTGTHLSQEYGHTVDLIREDGISKFQEIPIIENGSTAKAVAKTLANSVERFASRFADDTPDLLLLLGDRYETFGIAAAATLLNVPIAHLHGGETTEGAYDEAFRHSITKMSHLHFTSTETHRKRVIQMGEHPSRVFNVGAIGLDAVRSLAPLSKEELFTSLGLASKQKYFVVTFHPETHSVVDPKAQIDMVMEELVTFPDIVSVVTRANADTGGSEINIRLDEWSKRFPEQIRVFSSLGHSRYLSALRYSIAVVGNSSSGIIEAPSLGIPTLDVGSRQKGRMRADSVFNCTLERGAIADGLSTITASDFVSRARKTRNPYGDGKTTERILSLIRSELPSLQVAKSFYDLSP